MNVFFLARIDPFETTIPHVKAVGPAIKEWLILMGAILAVAAIFGLWVMFSGKSRRHRARREERRRRRQAFRSANTEADARGDKPPGRRRRRKHHRPRNPTLAETGGLPPVRREDQESQVPPH